MTQWAWVTQRLPVRPKHRTERQLRKLSKRALAERCWAATVNEDWASYSAAEWAARAFELADMLEGRRPTDAKLLVEMRRLREHVVACRLGSCEHTYAALVRATAHEFGAWLVGEGVETNARRMLGPDVGPTGQPRRAKEGTA